MRKRSVFLYLMCLIFCLSAAGCGSADAPPSPALSAVFSLEKTTLELQEGGAPELLFLRIENIDEAPVWQSNHPEIASVTVGSAANRAAVQGNAEGYAVISVTAGDFIAVCKVHVTAAAYLTLPKEEMELFAGTTERIAVSTNVTDPLRYTSDAPTVASVDSTGLVTALGEGVAHIKVTGGGCEAVCTVIVHSRPA